MRLKRKQIRMAALGDRFAIAIGKDVSMAELRRKKAARGARHNNNRSSQRSVDARSSN